MATHGRIDVLNKDDRRKITLYTWHDGHCIEAAEMLMHLPWTLFEAAKFSANDRANHKYDNTSRADLPPHAWGPWFYQVFGPHKVENLKRYKTREDLDDLWQSAWPLELSPMTLANWIVWRQFGMWMVVPDVSYTSFCEAGPDVTVTIGGGVGYDVDPQTYVVAFTVSPYPGWGDLVGNMWKRVEAAQANLNDRIDDSACHIQVVGSDRSKPPKIVIPIIDIIMDAFWQDFEKTRRPDRSI